MDSVLPGLKTENYKNLYCHVNHELTDKGGAILPLHHQW